MLKLGKFGMALTLALIMSLALLTSGAFAQSAQTSHSSHSNNVRTAVVTTTPQGVLQTLQATQTRQATQKLNWRPGGGWWARGGGGWWGHHSFHRHFFHRHFFHHHFFHRHCRCW